MDSYDIRFWDIKKTGSGTAGRYRVRWAVNGREHCKSFKARCWPTGSSPRRRTRSATGGPSTLAPACPRPRSAKWRLSPGTPTPRLHRGQMG
jgi:hypothetical protein